MSDKKVKVCFFILNAYPLFNPLAENLTENRVFGGAEIDLYNIACCLAKSDKYDVTFLIGDYGQKDIEYYNNVKVIKLKNVADEENKRRFFHKVYRKLILICQLMKIDSYVFITETASEMLGWLAIAEKLIMRRKLIFRLASDVNTDLDYYKDNKKLYTLYKYGIFHTDRIICQSEQQKQALSAKLGLAGSVIKNAFIFNDTAISPDKKYILWVARAIQLKRPELFLEIAKRIPDRKFVIIIVPVDKAIFSSIKLEAGKLPNVELIDYVAYPKIQKYYEEAELFVNTSEIEGFPNTFIQACIAKTPILSFRIDPDGIIGKYGLGFLCNDSLDKAVEFIRSLDGEAIRRYGENAYKYARDHHDMQKTIEEYKVIINETAK